MNVHGHICSCSCAEKLQERIWELESQLEDLKGERDYIPRLSPTENYIVQCLLSCSPRTMSAHALHDRICEEFGRNPKMESLKVQVCHARRKLAEYGIEIHHIYYHGYLIDARNKRKCQALMKGEIA